MKNFTDYTDEEALDLWVSLMEPMSVILADKDFVTNIGKVPAIISAKYLISNHKAEIKDIILTVDPTPITAVNLPIRVVKFLLDIINNEEAKDFFSSLNQMNTEE